MVYFLVSFGVFWLKYWTTNAALKNVYIYTYLPFRLKKTPFYVTFTFGNWDKTF